MVKSPVEGSTAALVRLQTPVAFSDFVRPICLPDDDSSKNTPSADYQIGTSSYSPIDRPRAEKYAGKIEKTFTEDQQYFKLSEEEEKKILESANDTEFSASELVENLNSLRPEPQYLQRSISYYGDQNQNGATNVPATHQWTQCTTLGWSRQKEHLQRVQLKLIDMKACENISITTVNSVCAEATFHKQDCNVSILGGFLLGIFTFYYLFQILDIWMKLKHGYMKILF